MFCTATLHLNKKCNWFMSQGRLSKSHRPISTTNNKKTLQKTTTAIPAKLLNKLMFICLKMLGIVQLILMKWSIVLHKYIFSNKIGTIYFLNKSFLIYFFMLPFDCHIMLLWLKQLIQKSSFEKRQANPFMCMTTLLFLLYFKHASK